ncbi:cytosolic phospholipase A2-like [Limulus polyphemus]|uniref:Phospholipase A2 n=1 Tax=Limulus polyphemus TaxID=6850 RepID=A0ABM1S6D5_LIMPO|nr:cytosolic phospholipase A2-like [Limulus polyphemus]XP_022239189.1 cytosolic phospholipase A2-like [Limulus polyphemus]XP_022239190.1 cytosolic phospholipase A2-like [Limulus polyphemus]
MAFKCLNTCQNNHHEEDKGFNPYQIFAVSPTFCHILHVEVLEGTGITKGKLSDFVDTPDPYIVLKVPCTPNGKKRTRWKKNLVNPSWKETFTFVVDPEKDKILEVTLKDYDYIFRDDVIGTQEVDLSTLEPNKAVNVTVSLHDAGEISLNLKLELNTKPDLRYELGLCEEELEFLKHRKHRVLKGLQAFLGEDGVDDENDAPVIAVIGSGGGFRALTCLSGVFKGLSETGLLDCATYVAGLSGSAWYLSALYSHHEFPVKGPGDIQKYLRNCISQSPFRLLGPHRFFPYINSILTKYKRGQPVSFTDFFGHLLGDTLLKDDLRGKNKRLSEQQSKINVGQSPLPLYTCLHVKKDVAAPVYHEWLEFSPYEVGIAKYGTFMKTEHFGCKFYKGKIIKFFEEQPLHYLQGVWGSAFTILFKRLIQNKTKISNLLSSEQEVNFDEVDSPKESGSQIKTCNDEEEELKNCLEQLAIVETEETDSTESSDSDDEDETDNPDKKDTESEEKDGYITKTFNQLIESVCSSSVFNNRRGRAGMILNPLLGLALIPLRHFSPISPITPTDDMWYKGIHHPANTQTKSLYLVDGGLTFNLPFPLLLRPSRKVNIFLTFDFSGRPSDDAYPFKELLQSEQWAQRNGFLFPPIKDRVEQLIKEPMRECYIFDNPDDISCPIILHFPLVNINFRKFKQPGLVRQTDEEIQFADFDIFSDPDTPYSIYNFCYTHYHFDRLSKLMEFNLLNNLQIIKDVVRKVMTSRIQNPSHLKQKLRNN